MPRRILIILTCLSLLGVGSVSAQTIPTDDVSPSEAQDSTALAEQFTISINDQAIEVRTWGGPDWLARFDRRTTDGAAAAEAVEALLAAAEADVTDLTVATTAIEYRPGNFAAISAFRIPDTDMVGLRQEVVRVATGPIEAHIAWGNRGARIVLHARDADIPGAYPIRLYFVDDTGWVVPADQPMALAIVAGPARGGAAARRGEQHAHGRALGGTSLAHRHQAAGWPRAGGGRHGHRPEASLGASGSDAAAIRHG